MRTLLHITSLALAATLSLAAADTLAVVNGKAVTMEDINLFLSKVNPNINFATLPPEVKSRILDQVIERQLLMNEAIKSGIKKDSEFEKARAHMEDDLALDIWMKKKLAAISISEDEAKKFYEENKASFKQPLQLKAKHILVKTEEEAKKIIAELKTHKGEKLVAAFEEVAKKYSKDPGSGASGGDLGWFQPQQMVKPFSDATLKLRKGEMTLEPAKTDFGYHIIYLEDRKDERTADFAEVKHEIVRMKKMEKFKAMMMAKAKELRSKAKIELK
ncbi:MAG: peptidylprolyl isomerase [Campylobacterales bacterium]